MLKRFSLHIIWLLLPVLLLAQEEIPVRVITVDDAKLPLSFKKYERNIQVDELELKVGELLSDLLTSGYATASADRWAIENDTARIFLYLGKQYKVTGLHIADSNRFVTDEIGLRKNWEKKAYMTSDFLTSVQERILVRMEDNGYPYASVSFENARLDSTELELDLSINRGPLIYFDTIHNVNKAKITRGYLKAYTGVKDGKVFNQSLVAAMDERLAELPFLRVMEPTRLWFTNDDKAHVEVFLENRKVSKFDFLIGVLPNNAESGKVLVVGEAGISLWNLFGTGKKIDVGWKRLKAKSQQLNIYFDYPYILGTPLGADVNFKLDKQDTSYLDLDWSIGIQYLFRGSDKIKVIVNNTQTFLQNADTTFVRNTGKLPPILDQSSLLTGLETYFEKLDYVYNPSRGWELGATITAGLKKIKRNTSILAMEFDGQSPTTEMLYDSLGTRSGKFEVKWLANYFIPLASKQVIKVGINGASIYNKSLLTNELRRVGGHADLRGFDEESIFASLYNIMTVEYRYLLDRNAYLSAFFNWAYVEQRLANSFENDFPLGFGAGLTFETKAGIFGLSYAVGRQQSNPLEFRSSKIHFGYVNIF
ncbi:MAG: BamA/TamA family outer membrane protein [Bacteroidetes bacterium]|nr:BamA/TamA family outer membrane protein [Bacteroidota bacterium]